MLLEAHPAIAQYIAETYLPLWEEELQRRIFIVAASEFAWEKFRLDVQGPIDIVERRVEQMEQWEAQIRVYRTTSS
jgi:ribonuclease G